MKIISKYKDYYDYLIGIYGEDEKIILDRRNFEMPKIYTKEKNKFTIHLCDLIIDGLQNGEKFYYGETLKEFEKKVPKWYYKYMKTPENIIYIECENTLHKIQPFNIIPVKDDKNINSKLNCPIILDYGIKQYYFPILSKLNLQSFLSPDEIYKILYQWISDRNTMKENKPDKRSDVEKLLGKGFDKKISFRHRK